MSTLEPKTHFAKRLDEHKRFFAQMASDLKLDYKCQALLMTFFINQWKEMGFGELYREIERIRRNRESKRGGDEEARKDPFYFKRPTLSEHLHHLKEKGIIKGKTVRDKRYPLISPKKYCLTPLIRQIAKDYLSAEPTESGAFDFRKMIHNMEDDNVVLVIFLMFGIYGLRALDYTMSIERESLAANARSVVYGVYDETLKSWRTAILESGRKDQILKACNKLSSAFDAKDLYKKFV